MQLRQPEAVGALDDQRVRRRDVEPALDDGRRNQDVVLLVQELAHLLFELVLRHLPVHVHHPRLGHQALQLLPALVDRLHPVVDEEHLTVAVDLAKDDLTEARLLEHRHLGVHRGAPLRRLHEARDVACPEKGEVQRARDRGRGQGEDVHHTAQLLEALLVRHPEALLLVDDDQPQILEADVLREESVRPDQNVELPVARALEDVELLLARPEAAETVDADRELRHAVAEGHQVLLRENGGRHQHRHLLPRLHHLERGAHPHLGLAVADVAAHQSIHRAETLQVLSNRLDRFELVGGLLVGERFLELLLIVRIGRKGVTVALGAHRLNLHHLRREIVDRILHLGALFRPRLPADAVEEDVGRSTDVLLHQVDALGGNEELHSVAELERQVIAAARAVLDLADPEIATDAVRNVHHQVVLLELQEAVDRARRDAALRLLRRQRTRATEDIAPREEHRARLLLPAEAGGELPDQRKRGAGDVRLRQDLAKALRLRELAEVDLDRSAPVRLVLERHAHPIDRTAEGLHPRDRELDRIAPPLDRQRLQLEVRQVRPLRPELRRGRIRPACLPLPDQRTRPLLEFAWRHEREQRVLRETREERDLGTGEATHEVLRLLQQREHEEIDFVAGALVVDRDHPDRVDLVAEEVEAVRVRPLARVDVEYPAADREVPGARHLREAAVAGVDEGVRELVHREGIADAEEQATVARLLLRTSDRLEERLERRDHAPRLTAGERLEHGVPLRKGVGVGLGVLLEERLPERELLDGAIGEGRPVAADLLRLVDARGHEHDRAVGLLRQVAEDEAARRPVRPTDGDHSPTVEPRHELGKDLGRGEHPLVL